MTTKDLDLTSLRLFGAICDTGSIARVAERERLVPSAVSKRMVATHTTRTAHTGSKPQAHHFRKYIESGSGFRCTFHD